jgi:L-threonylcarbamoyladenylate synthase
MRIVSISPNEPREDRLAPAVQALAAGGVVALPTETFYGLAVDAFDAAALVRLNRLKGKEENAPVLLLVADREQAAEVAAELPPVFSTLAERFWPGPLTLVVKASAKLPDAVSSGRGTVALRVPGLALPRNLAALLGRPMSGVSANMTGQPPSRSALEVARAFPEGLDVILDGGPTTGGAPSTILDLTSSEPRVVREGLVPWSSIEPFLSRSV